MQFQIFRKVLVGLTIVSSLLCTPAAFSQNEDPDSTRMISLPTVVAEAFRNPVGIDSVPYSVSLATARLGMAGTTLADLLVEVPGVLIDNRFNAALGDRISIRGFGARTQFGVRGIRVVADGVPATFADGQSALEIVDPAWIERAEVIRGPASSLYGNAAGGVLVLRSADIPAIPLEVSADVTAGGAGLLRLAASGSGSGEGAGYRLRLSSTKLDGFREHSASKMQRAAADVYLATGTHDSLLINGGYVRFEAENPGAIADSLFGALPTAASASSISNGAGKDGEQGQASLLWRRSASGRRLEVGTHVIRRVIDNPIVGRVIALERTAGGGHVLLGRQTSLGGVAIDVSVGGEVDLQLDDRQNYTNVGGERGRLLLDQKERVAGMGLFLQAMAEPMPMFRLMGGLRYDRTRFAVSDRLIDSLDPDDSGERTLQALSPSLGALWNAADWIDLFANLSTAFETPTTTELANRPDSAGGFNPDLDPQRALSFELGSRVRIGTLLSASIALYRVTIDDELIPFQVPGNEGRDFFRNAGSAVHQGAEASLSLFPISGARVTVGYTHTDARFEAFEVAGKRYDGNLVPGVSPDRGSVDFEYHSSLGWYGGLNMIGVTGSAVNDANSATSDGYALFSLRAGHLGLELGEGRWQYRVALFGGVSNLLDTRYDAAITVNAVGGRYHEPGQGRTFYAGLEMKLIHGDE